MPRDLVLLSTLTGSNYPCLELSFMVPKVFEPLKFDCMSDCRTPYINIHFEEARPLGAFYYEFIRVGRGGGAGGGRPP